MENRRLFSRVPCNLPILVGSHLGELLDIGLGGTRIRSEGYLGKGAVVRIRPIQGGAFHTLNYQVIWSKSSEGLTEMGLRYPEELDNIFWQSWAADLLAGAEIKNGEILERRNLVRLACHLTGVVTLNQEKSEAKVLDIGQGGALLQMSPEIELGSELSLTLSSPVRVGGLKCAVRRRWEGKNDFGYGVSFIKPSKRHRTGLSRLLDHLLAQRLG